MTNRLASVLMAFFILATSLGAPSPSRLVCRISGAVMLASSADRKTSSCCVTHHSLTKEGITQETLSKSSCCELRPSVEKTVTPSVLARDSALVYILAPERAMISPPAYTLTLSPVPSIVCVPLRGPPTESDSPRGPPAFS